MSWLKNLSRVIPEAVASTVSAVSLVTGLIADCAWMAGHEDYELPLPAYVTLLLAAGLISAIDAYVHYTINDEYFEKSAPKEVPKQSPPKSPPSTSSTSLLQPDVLKPTFKHRFLVFFGTLACSLEGAGAPAAVIYALEGMKFVTENTTGLHEARFGLSLLASGAAIWNSGAQWNLEMRHLLKYEAAKQHACMARV